MNQLGVLEWHIGLRPLEVTNIPLFHSPIKKFSELVNYSMIIQCFVNCQYHSSSGTNLNLVHFGSGSMSSFDSKSEFFDLKLESSKLTSECSQHLNVLKHLLSLSPGYFPEFGAPLDSFVLLSSNSTFAYSIASIN